MYFISHSFLCNTTPEAFMKALSWELNNRATEEVRNSGRILKQTSAERFYQLQSIPDVHETDAGGMKVFFDGYFYSDPVKYSHPLLDPFGYKDAVIEFNIQPTSPTTIKVIAGCLSSVSEDDYNELLAIIGELYSESKLKTKPSDITPPPTNENKKPPKRKSLKANIWLIQKYLDEGIPLEQLVQEWLDMRERVDFRNDPLNPLDSMKTVIKEENSRRKAEETRRNKEE